MITRILNQGLKKFNLSIRPLPVIADLGKEFLELYEKCKPFTMTSMERMYAAFQAIDYIEKAGIEGSVVECGVWKGGSSMIMAYNLIRHRSVERELFLYDTYEGMPEPSEKDVDVKGQMGIKNWLKNKDQGINQWCYAPLEEVKKNLLSTGYPEDKIHFIKGKVEETIPGVIPAGIAVLRLDTDWYESSYHEIKHLFPLLSKNGMLILDDYGHWQGQKEAINKYFDEQQIGMYLHRIDYTGRAGIKTN